LAGIVVGLAAMITTILSKLQGMLATQGGATEIAGTTVTNLTTLFKLDAMIPPYWLQVVVGIYLIEIIYILTVTLVAVESGVDKLGEKSEIAKHMKTGITLYVLAALTASLVLSILAGVSVG
jgi:hypothetical protein